MWIFGGFKLPVPIGGIKLTMQMYWEFWRKMPWMCLRIFEQELGEFYGGGWRSLRQKSLKRAYFPTKNTNENELFFNFQIFFHPDFCFVCWSLFLWIHGEVIKACYQNWILDNLDERIHVGILVQRDPARTSNSPFGCLQLTSHFPTHPPPPEQKGARKKREEVPTRNSGSFCRSSGSWMYFCMGISIPSINSACCTFPKGLQTRNSACCCEKFRQTSIQAVTPWWLQKRFDTFAIQIMCSKMICRNFEKW